MCTECDLEQACKDIGEQMERSFQKGPFSTKGCYLYYNEKDLRRYGNKIYYGTGGDDAEKISKIDPESSKKRPPGFNCSAGIVLFHINLVQITNSFF